MSDYLEFLVKYEAISRIVGLAIMAIIIVGCIIYALYDWLRNRPGKGTHMRKHKAEPVGEWHYVRTDDAWHVNLGVCSNCGFCEKMDSYCAHCGARMTYGGK